MVMMTFTLLACGKQQDDGCKITGNDGGKYSCENLDQPMLPIAGMLTLNPSTGVPLQAQNFSVSAAMEGFDSSQTRKILDAKEMIEIILSTEDFRDEVINYTYLGKKQFADNGGLSNEDVYLTILQGAEKLFPVVNYTMDINLRLYYEDSLVLGYTAFTSTAIMLNLKYFDFNPPEEVAGTLVHEWLHKLGFTHVPEYSDHRQNSVPYAVGYIMRRLARNL
jgi:hypothetical protein